MSIAFELFNRIETLGDSEIIATGMAKMDFAAGDHVRALDVLLEPEGKRLRFDGDPTVQVQFLSTDASAVTMAAFGLQLHREPQGLRLKITGQTIDATPIKNSDYYVIYTAIGRRACVQA